MYFDEENEMDPEDFAKFVAGIHRVGKQLLETGKRAEEHANRWAQYYDDPVGYFRDVLGVEPWESEDPNQGSQADLIRAVGAHDRVACKSGHRIGKSLTAIGLALWFVCTRTKARVMLTAPTFRQVKEILWRELSLIYEDRKLETLLGVGLPLDPATGLKLPNGNQIVGLSTKKPESMAGFAGANLFFVVDEGSGFPDDIWTVLLSGNSAGGAKIFVISNPTRTSGWFFELFRSKSPRWKLFSISSENTPNVRAGVKLTPGLATSEYIAEMRENCGPDWENDAVYMVRVRGEFPPQGTDAVVSLSAIERSTVRWVSARDAAPEAAQLSLGVDVGRFGSDPSVVQPVRGNFAHKPREYFKADGPTIASRVIEYATELRINGEQVRVVVDGIGVGASVVDALKYSKPVQDGWMILVDLNVGEAPDDEHHEKLRDQIWFSCSAWIKEGGMLPDHDELSKELLAATYSFTIRNRKKVMSKDQMRAILGRSPDYADALCMAVYNGPRGRAYDFSYDAAPDPRHTSHVENAWDDVDEGDERGEWG